MNLFLIITRFWRVLVTQLLRLRWNICIVLLVIGLTLSLVSFVWKWKAWNRIAQNTIYFLDIQGDLSVVGESNNWEIEGWTYYANQADFKRSVSRKLPFLGEFQGVWVAKEPMNVMRLKEFQNRNSLLPVGFGMRIFLEGTAQLEIKLSYDGYTENIHIEPNLSNVQQVKENETFCNKIIQIPENFNGILDEIEIRGMPKRDSTSFIIIDKLIVTLGEAGTQQRLLFSLLPNEWCDLRGQHDQAIVDI